MKVFITGGTGFLGGSLIRLLSESGQHELYGLARSDKSASALQASGVKPVLADLTDCESLKAAFSELQPQVIFHLAAEIASQRSKKMLRAANVDGTRNLHEAAKTCNDLKSFIFASTVVTGEANGELLTEDVPLNVETEYGRTKQESEKSLMNAFTSDSFPAMVLRPCHIYGDGGWFGDVLSQIESNSLRMPGNGKNLWDVAYVDDVARALICLMEHGVPGEIYHACDGTPVTMGEFVNESATLAGAKMPGYVPRFVANLAIGKDTVTSVIRSARTSNEKLKAIGWVPEYADYRAGLKKTHALRTAN